MDEKPDPEFIVYDADSEHRCITEGAYPVEMSAGSVVRCDCGQYWYRTFGSILASIYGDEFLGPRWVRVYWWNRRALKRIREWEASK